MYEPEQVEDLIKLIVDFGVLVVDHIFIIFLNVRHNRLLRSPAQLRRDSFGASPQQHIDVLCNHLARLRVVRVPGRGRLLRLVHEDLECLPEAVAELCMAMERHFPDGVELAFECKQIDYHTVLLLFVEHNGSPCIFDPCHECRPERAT